MDNVVAQVGDGQHDGLLALAATDGQHKVVVVGLPLAMVVGLYPRATDDAPHLHMMAREQGARGFETVGRIVIARSDDDLHRGTFLAGVGKETVVGCLRCCRWIAVVEDVARDEQGIGLLILNLR